MWRVEGSTPAARTWNGGALATACVLAIAATARESAAQSPFTQPPSPTGAFSLPSPGPTPPNAGAPGATAPGATSSRPLTTPASLTPRVPGSLRPLEVPSIDPLPVPPPGEPEVPNRPLPPRPEVAPPLQAAPTGAAPRGEPTVLQAGKEVTLRVCQVLPKDGLSSGERLLNSRPAIQPGDCFLAEVVEPRPPYPILVGGTITGVTPPGRYGRPGHVSVRMTQLVQSADGQAGLAPWRMDMVDRRFTTKMRRVLLTTLLGLEGAGTGASVGAQFSGGNMAFIGGGMGVGALVGLGYASFQRGVEASFEPGETFTVTMGTTEYRPVSREWQTILYPAADPGGRGRKHP